MMANRFFPDPPPEDDRFSARAAKAGVSLARRADFRLGGATVRCSLRSIEGPAGNAKVEPMVLQVLLALVDAGGAVLTRDDFTEICWGGRIVGDDSLNRTIAEIRRIARATGGDFLVETVPKIGYRLVGTVEVCESADPVTGDVAALRHGLPRRSLITGTAVSAIVLATGGAGFLLLRPRPDSQAAALVLRGAQALRDDLPDSAEQGVGFLQEAVGRVPRNALAWGLLALAWREVAEHAPADQVAAAVNNCEAAARQSLAIDPREANALAALAALRPAYGDWLAAEDRLRNVIALTPDHAWSLATLGYLMESVGRSRESTALTERAAALEPLSPVYQYRLAYKHYILGRAVRADQVVDRAIQLWPRHPAVLFARFLIFIYTGRYQPALAMVNGEANPSLGWGEAASELWRTSLAALQSRAPADVARAVDAQAAASIASPGAAVVAIQIMCLLGEIDAAFAIADGYLLRRGPLVGNLRTADGAAAVNDQRWRKTVMLFNPSTAPMRTDGRFQPLVEAMGLAEYWRRRGVAPDYAARTG